MAKMNTKMKLLTFILLLPTTISFASERITVKKEFENVILFYDGNTNNEEYIKLEFIAKRVVLLSKQYNYTEKIILNFLFLTADTKRDYFIAYSVPKYFIKHKNHEDIREHLLMDDDKKYINLTAYDQYRNQMETLKLVDFALSDLNSFKKLTVNEIQYDRFEFEYNYVYTIASKTVQKITNNKVTSEKIVSALSEKIYRETDNKENTYFISYFTKNDKYFPYLRERNKESVIDTLNEIKHYARELNNVFVFKNNFEFNFYAFPYLGEDLIVKRNVIYNKDEDFYTSFIEIDEILMGVYIIKYGLGRLGIIESSLYSIEKGMIENKLSKYEHQPAIRF
jgi:hypothetical protein